MNSDITTATMQYAVRLGDDALVLGHRLSEWVSNAPFLEEDIALGNVALDYIGRSRFYYGYGAELAGDGKTEDDFAFLRDEREFQNYLIHELPRGDFAFTMARQLMVDTFNHFYLQALCQSSDAQLAAIAEKAIKETRYHLRRSTDWTMRLGDGTEESHRRMQTALDSLWDYSHELFEPDDLEQYLIEQNIAVDTRLLKAPWLEKVGDILEQATLSLPDHSAAVRGGRQGYHTENLGHLLAEMQFVHRCYPGCQW